MVTSSNYFLCLNIFIAILFNTQWLTSANGEQRRVKNLMGNKAKPGTNNLFPSDSDDNEEGEIRRRRQAVFSPRLKYLPFKLNESYSNLQVPTRDTAHLHTLSSDEIQNNVNSELYAISVTLRIREVNDIDELNEEITFTADIMLEWTDYVIRMQTLQGLNVDSDEVYRDYDDMFRTLDPILMKQIWKPDVFIENLVKVTHPEILSPPASVKFNQVTGKFVYWTRMRIKMECQMDFRFYPADTQKCKVEIRSSNYEISELRIYWAATGSAAFLEDCSGSNFDLKISDVDNFTKKIRYRIGETRTFDILSLDIVARRSMSYHIVQTYLPSVFFIVITWLCFLLPSEMIEARIGISMTTLLTLTAMFASVRESTPMVSYVKAIDIWMLACIFFIFLPLLEFTVVLWLRHMKKALDSEEEANQKKEIEDANLYPAGVEKSTEDEVLEVEMQPLKHTDATNKPPSQRGKLNNGRRRRVEFCQSIAEFLENHAFLLFSFLFILFCACYWYWILIYSDHLNWEVDGEINCPPEVEQDV